MHSIQTQLPLGPCSSIPSSKFARKFNSQLHCNAMHYYSPDMVWVSQPFNTAINQTEYHQMHDISSSHLPEVSNKHEPLPCSGKWSMNAAKTLWYHLSCCSHSSRWLSVSVSAAKSLVVLIRVLSDLVGRYRYRYELVESWYLIDNKGLIVFGYFLVEWLFWRCFDDDEDGHGY